MTLDQEMQLFLDALERDGKERERFLEAIEDSAVREHIVELLDTHENEATAALPALEAGEAPQAHALIGASIDGFKILERIGEGGMGVVYLAEQERPRRRVALKIVHAAASKETLRRFEHEAEILARLEHPGIARLYGTGVATTGFGELPYLALEWVDGVPLDSFAERFRSGGNAEGQIELLTAVCDALAFAHAQGVIHRDLKPGNILVDNDGRPKILDFGIARIMDEAPAQTLATRTGQMLGTLSYMSPEQLAGRTQDVDTRSDVYALGIVAFELLTGRRPIDVSGLSITRAIHELVDREPSRLSRVDARLRGDLDVVIAKALRKERDERYQSVAEFSADLRRILRHEPITARAPSATYQLRKLVRRHRIVFASIALVILGLSAGIVLALVGKKQADRALGALQTSIQSEKDATAAADARAVSMRNVVDYIVEMLQLASPADGETRVIRLDALIRAISGEGVENSISTDPLAQGLMLFNIAAIHTDRAESEKALALIERARPLLRDSKLATPVDRVALERLLFRIQRQNKATRQVLEATIDRALALSERLEGEDRFHHAMVLGMRADLARAFGENDRAARLAAEVIAIAAELPNFPPRDLGSIHQHLGMARYGRSRFAEAATAYESARDLYDRSDRAILHRIHIRRLLSDAYRGTGRIADAIRAAQTSVELAEARNLEIEAARSQVILADAQTRDGRHDAAARAWARAIPLLARSNKRHQHAAFTARMARAWSNGQNGALERAIEESRELAKYAKTRYGSASPYFAMSLQRLARLELKRPKADRAAAERYLRRALSIWEKSKHAGNATHVTGACILAGLKIEGRDWPAAERAARSALRLAVELDHHSSILDASIHLASALKMQGQRSAGLEVFDSVRSKAQLLARMSEAHIREMLDWAEKLGDAERSRVWTEVLEARRSRESKD